MEHVLTMANLKLKPSLFTPHPIANIKVFLIEILRFAKAGKSKQSSLTHDLASSLVCTSSLTVTLGLRFSCPPANVHWQ